VRDGTAASSHANMLPYIIGLMMALIALILG
jgi:hypothetical protein